ncbi:MAG: hypothetical protein NZM35_09750 [Chitinophagales bacterium]|nr:hypothetical protein [Chitinophagales bacterium]MDW8419964.1 hypothetical protein [Chitinophagales bacterium]
MNIAAYIEQLTAHANRLVAALDKLQSEKQLLEMQVQTLRERLAESYKKNAELTESLKIIKLARNIQHTEGSTSNAEWQKLLNEYIREIDNCIANLND